MTTIPESTWGEARALAGDTYADMRDDEAEQAVSRIAHALHRARQEATEKAEQRVTEILKDAAAVHVNWLRGGINASSIKATIAEEHAGIASRYADDFENGLPMYGTADKDAGRGRQEGHVAAGREIAALIRKGRSHA